MLCKYQIRLFVGFDAEEAMPLVWRAVNVTKSSRVGHVLGDERNLVNGVMV